MFSTLGVLMIPFVYYFGDDICFLHFIFISE
jgi:hypothetical protein